MARTDAPALRLRVDALRLVPASGYDQERLSSYRNGSTVYATIKQPKNEKLNRKFHAIMHRVLADCETPWKTVEEAKDSLKMALGVTRQVSSLRGDVVSRYPGSLADLDDPGFVDFYEGAMAILHRMTGVDPETLHQESADVGEDEQEPASEVDPPSADADGSGDPVAASDPAPNPSAAADLEPEAEAPPPAETSGSSPDQRRECINKLLGVATDKDLSKDEAAQILGDRAEDWTGALPEDQKGFVRAVYDTCRKVLKGELPADKARTYLEGLL